MNKRCICGRNMEIKLHTIVHSNKVEIVNVPVYTCPACQRNELHEDIKSDLTRLISSLGFRPEKQLVHFDEVNEWARLFHEARDRSQMPLEVLVEERINQLLDLLLLSRSLKDSQWAQEIRGRLSQMARYSLIPHSAEGE